MEKEKKMYHSYMGEFYAANPAKFEKRKNHVKPKLYWALAVIAVILIIYPGFIPVTGWLVRTVAIIVAVVSAIAAWMSSFDIYNIQSGGKVKDLGVKKFKRNETDMQSILNAFLEKNFEYLANLPGGRSEPVQLNIEEDPVGHEMYCLLTTYDADSNIVGLADVITLSDDEYEDNIDLIKQMYKDEDDN